MVSFATLWPWIALGAAGLLLILLARGDTLAQERRGPRWQDLDWLILAGLALTLLHQFEESGLDLSGRPGALLGALCTGFGFRDAVACPIPLAAVTGFNVATVWIAALIAVFAGRRHPLVGLTIFVVPLGNLILHLGAAIGLARYNPGLGTALLMLPVAAWTLLVAAHRHAAGPKVIALLFAGAAVTAGGSFALLLAARHGFLGDGMLLGAFALLGLVPAALMLATSPRRPAAPPPRPRRAPKKATGDEPARRRRRPESAASGPLPD